MDRLLWKSNQKRLFLSPWTTQKLSEEEATGLANIGTSAPRRLGWTKLLVLHRFKLLSYPRSLGLLFSRSVVSHSLWPHGLQHARPPCPSTSSRACSNSCPLIESVMPSNHLILCCPLLLLPSIFPSIRVFSNEWVLCIRWPDYWSFSFSISPSNEYSGLISFSYPNSLLV